MFSVSYSGWVLQPVATVHSKQPMQHVAWSPFDPRQAAFICQDGSLHTLAVKQQPDGSLGVQVGARLTCEAEPPVGTPIMPARLLSAARTAHCIPWLSSSSLMAALKFR